MAATLVLLANGRIRYDLVALIALVTLVLTGVVDAGAAFIGFGHPAVVTVAAVLVISRGLQRSGFVDRLAGLVQRVGRTPTIQYATLLALVTFASAFMNNVGALALLIPAAIKLARAHGVPPSRYLMPLSFSSLLGGLITLIGTPPNIIVSGFRAASSDGRGYGMFSFTPVGGVVAAAGVLLILLVARWLVPDRSAGGEHLFEIEGYLTELSIPQGAPIVGQSISALRKQMPDGMTLVEHVRGQKRSASPLGDRKLSAGDILLIRSNGADLADLIASTGLQLGSKLSEQEQDQERSTLEAVIRPGSALAGRTVEHLRVFSTYGLTILAVSRPGARLRARIGKIRLRAGDVVLAESAAGSSLSVALSDLGLLPLAERSLSLAPPRLAALAVSLFAGALALVIAGLVPVAIALTAAAVVMVLAGVININDAYQSIDWPIIVLLGAMFPLSVAVETSGAAARIAGLVLNLSAGWPGWAAVGLVMLGTMMLSNVVNNAAAALLMAPVALAVAIGLGASADPFLMAVALGASCAFLTPIGHQSNTLVMGPGGYRFGDYWRLGVPLTILILLLGVPMLMLVWPL
jgi:di/tricarboxylate transporter